MSSNISEYPIKERFTAFYFDTGEDTDPMLCLVRLKEFKGHYHWIPGEHSFLAINARLCPMERLEVIRRLKAFRGQYKGVSGSVKLKVNPQNDWNFSKIELELVEMKED